jgi:hypothetical protein
MSTNPHIPFDPSLLDAVSLTQALKDFEIANARVLDLTRRLIESERLRKELADELERLRLQQTREPAAANRAFALMLLRAAQKARQVGRRLLGP